MTDFDAEIAVEIAERQAEERAAYERIHEAAEAGLRSALDNAREGLLHAVRHLGTLTDELYDVEYAEDTAGTDLGETIDQAAALIRSAQRTAELLQIRSGATS